MSMTDKELKNERLMGDIQNEFSPAEAKLALGILKMIEESGDNQPDSGEMKRFAKKVFDEMEEK